MQPELKLMMCKQDKTWPSIASQQGTVHLWFYLFSYFVSICMYERDKKQKYKLLLFLSLLIIYWLYNDDENNSNTVMTKTVMMIMIK